MGNPVPYQSESVIVHKYAPDHFPLLPADLSQTCLESHFHMDTLHPQWSFQFLDWNINQEKPIRLLEVY